MESDKTTLRNTSISNKKKDSNVSETHFSPQPSSSSEPISIPMRIPTTPYNTPNNNSYELNHPIFQNSSSPSSPSDCPLEPISTLVRLIQLNYYPIGTKLSVHNGYISIQVPSFFQGTIRWKNGDQRNDLHHMYEAILQCPNHPMFTFPSFRYLFPHAIYGLENLVKTYTREEGSQLVIHSLKYYISLIQSWTNETSQQVSNPSMVQNRMYTIWEKEELELLKSILELLQQKRSRGDKYDYLLQMMDSILIGKEGYLDKK
jgi:hypothetical protein